jgi:alanine-synthesizing transaminase
MFSSRLSWHLSPNRLSEAVQARRLAGAPILDLTESNPTRAGFHYPSSAIRESLAHQNSLLYEPLPAGLTSAREAVAGYYAERGHVVDRERILLTASTSESYSYLFKLLADPGDEVLVPRPSYPLFEFLAELESVRVRQYPLIYDGMWSIDFDALRHATTPRTRAVVLVNPNNPTGSFLKCAELDQLESFCAGQGLAIISDEVFADFGFGEDTERVPTLAGVRHALTFSLSGLSKIAGLPQMKLGWLLTAGPDQLQAQARERLELIADTYLSVSTPVQHALPGLLAAAEDVRSQIASRTAANLDFLRKSLGTQSPCQLLNTEGGWYAVIRVPRTRSEEEWCLDLLEQNGVLVQPGYFFDFESEAFLVLSLLTCGDIFQEGIRRLLAVAGAQ